MEALPPACDLHPNCWLLKEPEDSRLCTSQQSMTDEDLELDWKVLTQLFKIDMKARLGEPHEQR